MANQPTTGQKPSLPSAQPKAWHWYRTWWGVLFIVGGVGLLGTLSFLSWRLLVVFQKNLVAASATNSSVVQTGPSGVTEDDPRFGNPDALIQVVEFGDFQCPFCKEAANIVRTVMTEYADDVLFIYRDFPVADLHPYAEKAAEAGACAHDQGKFWAMHDKLFEHQDALTVPDLKEYAVQVNLDSDTFNACLDSGIKAIEVAKDLQDGVALSKDLTTIGTPLFIINGFPIPGVITAEKWRSLLDGLLNAK